MVFLTKEQRHALKRVYDRHPLYRQFNGVMGNVFEQVPLGSNPMDDFQSPATYRQFRRTVRPYVGGDCVLVPWCGMWLGIETDGHTHS